MCGIAGVWGRANEPAVREMMRRMQHRGPDAHGLLATDHGTVGHRRLSIMDPVGGDQPIVAPDRRVAIAANGEIYNHPQLREELAERGCAYATGNDSESVLHLYRQEGVGAAAHLDGMFAFAIADGDDLYVARDPVGIKPLYYGRTDGAWAFASELKALSGLADEVREFPPGTWFHTRHGFRRYGELPDLSPEPLPVAEHCRRIRNTLERAVVKRLMSDVPVGAFLSGGLDSSLIAAIARQHLGELHTFSVGVEGSRDLEAARTVARHLDTVHHEYAFTPDEVVAALPEIVYHLESFDQDLVRSAIPCYFVSRLASDYVKVILTGEGADELFAGYRYYRAIASEDDLHRELRRSIASLHNINLQRVDRLTMAHAIEGRVPFLDLDLIAVAQRVPPSLKLRSDDQGRRTEKWILRKACEDLLPAAIVWRDKEQFDEGSGTVDFIAEAARGFAAGRDEAAPAVPLRSDEERAYYGLLLDAYPDPETVLANVGRWASRPDYGQHALS
jgi:asparagine synthase (glutamine-hydrolysing)